jgi:hypothetical protein
LEREESNKRQQLKILRKTHEVQMHEKDQLVDNLQSIISEQEEKIKELEDNVGESLKMLIKQNLLFWIKNQC